MPIFAVVRHLVRRAGPYREVALLGLALTVVLVGAGLFALAEHVSYGIGLYWSITTATTVGYGDVTPHNTAGRVIAAGVMLTTIPIVAAVFALVAGASALARIRRILGLDSSLPSQPFTVVYGSHPTVPHLLTELVRAGDPVVLVASARPTGIPHEVEFVGGDPADEDTVRRSQPERANRALIACMTDADTLFVAVALHHIAPQLEVYALTQSPRVARSLDDLGVTHTLASDELVGHTLAKSLETPEAGDLLLQLVDTDNYRLTEQDVDATFVSRPLSQARATVGTLVLGIARDGHVDLGLTDDPVLAAGDRLIVLTPTGKQ
jgi:voltage-gated potassium channel